LAAETLEDFPEVLAAYSTMNSFALIHYLAQRKQYSTSVDLLKNSAINLL